MTTLVAEWRSQSAELADPAVRWDADDAVTALYAAHYRELVRLSALLLRDAGAAEEVVQDAFVAMHGAWRRIRDEEKALAYLRRTVVNRSRSVLRRRVVADRYKPEPDPDVASAEDNVMRRFESRRVMDALRQLPPRQREALVLRYYGDLSEAQVAEAMKVSAGSVKTHTFRGMAALRTILEAR
ncbi:MAG: SigE family RNA polymerase sigma factor [Sporichthyaceae bacterium]